MGSATGVPMTVRGERARRDHVRRPPSPAARSAPDDLRLLEELGLRAAIAVDNARLYRAALGDRPARCRPRCCRRRCPRSPGFEAARALPGGRRRQRGRRRLLRPLLDRRGRVVRGHRRRLRQGRRGGRGDRARPLHDPRRGGAAALARRDPALAQRRDAAPGPRRPLLHDRLRAPRHVAPGDPRRRSRAAGIRCRCCAAPDGTVEELGAPGTLLGLVRRPAARATRATELRAGDTLVLYTDGLTEARRRSGCGRPRSSPRRCGRRGAMRRRSSSSSRRGTRGAAGGRRATTSRCWRCGAAGSRRVAGGPCVLVARRRASRRARGAVPLRAPARVGAAPGGPPPESRPA